MSQSSPNRIIKVVLIGDGYVGKTTLRRKYMGEKFETEYMMTIGADFAVKRVEEGDTHFALQIWDLAGQPQFALIRDRYYRSAAGIIIVFDVTKRETFENIPNWINEYMENNDQKLVPIVLVGNKTDLVQELGLSVSNEEVLNYIETLQDWGKNYNANFNAQYIETSAKFGTNVDDVFRSIIHDIK